MSRFDGSEITSKKVFYLQLLDRDHKAIGGGSSLFSCFSN